MAGHRASASCQYGVDRSSLQGSNLTICLLGTEEAQYLQGGRKGNGKPAGRKDSGPDSHFRLLPFAARRTNFRYRMRTKEQLWREESEGTKETASQDQTKKEKNKSGTGRASRSAADEKFASTAWDYGSLTDFWSFVRLRFAPSFKEERRKAGAGRPQEADGQAGLQVRQAADVGTCLDKSSLAISLVCVWPTLSASSREKKERKAAYRGRSLEIRDWREPAEDNDEEEE
ncbi:hypothetical protein R1sor_019060 [Riccia sorocarpa]|uniref:Uncharacterized protein n=1 Tax=Riccia sorocarpa TaxID=122646 RepID=A0ABD3IBI9_9MARC